MGRSKELHRRSAKPQWQSSSCTATLQHCPSSKSVRKDGSSPTTVAALRERVTRRRLRQLDRRAGNPQPGNHRQRPPPGPSRYGSTRLTCRRTSHQAPLAQVIHNRENLTRVRTPAAGCHVSRLTCCGSGSQVSPDGGPPGMTSAASSYVCPVDDAAEPFVIGVVIAPDDVPADHAGLFGVAGVVSAVQREVPQGRELGFYAV